MYKNELRMSRNVDEQPPGSTLHACRHHRTRLVAFVHPTPLIALMCTFWRGAWCFLSHGTLRRWIFCEMCWSLWRRNWISVHHDGFCSVLFNYTVGLAQTVSK